MKLVLPLFLLSVTVHAAIDRSWERTSDPAIRNRNYEKTFDLLPLNGSVRDQRKLWANDYWPRNRGSINYRWNSTDPTGFNLRSPTREEARVMKTEELATLAPTEKFDLLNGDYTYSLVKEVSRIAKRSAPIWEGICNGWAPASVNHNEPSPKTMTNPDGIAVPFGSSDIKALLSYYYAYHHQVSSTHQMGKRCNLLGNNCGQDLNAGAFHIVMANSLGIAGGSFISDVEAGSQVWNHAANDYRSTVIADNLPSISSSAPGTVKRIHIITEMIFVQSILANSWWPTNGTSNHINGQRHYDYMLDIDSSGKIIGGEWISVTRPDFIWDMEKVKVFENKFARLAELLDDES